MQHREKIATEESHKRLLESLYFPDMHAREEGIDEAHKHTFEWIFDKPGNEVRPWHNFVDWLQKGHGAYWISGKAGSGKSTLMNFVCHDPRTEAALKIWSGTNEIFTPNFFFWSPGSQLQKSLAGLLRSLIYQILERFPDSMPKLAESTGAFQHGLRQLPTWTEQRLRATLQNLLSVGLEKCQLCIFIDGLDEFHGDHVTLLNMISVFREITKVKFCLSSRPYSPFKHELGSSPMLKLQDLTEPDIRKYVSDRLEEGPLKAPWIPYSSSRFEDAVDTIVQKAEGVFLWVRLAVRDQLEGIRNGDDGEQLRERLQILPTEIEEVYCHMLHGIDKVYRKEVAQYIRLALDVEDGWSLFEVALAQHKRIDDILLFSEEISIWDIGQHCNSVGERIAATCKGFLEVRGFDVVQRDERLSVLNIPFEQREELRKIELLHKNTRVEFLHRTAFDFFNNKEHGKEFLNIHTIASTHPQVSYVKALLAALRTFPVSKDNWIVQGSIRSIMRNSSAAEEATGVAQLALMDLIDRSITLLWERTPGQPPNLHWYRLWGESRVTIEVLTERDWYHQQLIRQQMRQQMNFLGVAAWYGLDKYVQHMLDLQSRKREPDTVDNLLSCSVGGFRDDSGMNSSLKLVSALLKRGADPNKGVLESTVWGLFLRALHFACFYFDEKTWDRRKTYRSNTVKAFLKSGANVHERIYTSVSEPFHISPDLRYSEDSPLYEWYESVIELHLSTRSVLQWCFAKEANFFEIEHPLIASGATLYAKCTNFRLKVGKREGALKWIDLKPSERQSNQLTKIYEQALHQDNLPQVQVEEVFSNADIEQLYEPAPTGDESESESLQEEDSEEDQSNTDTDWITESSSIDVPASPYDEDEGSFYSAHSSQQEED